MASKGRTVFVLGAGFTRAFLPTAPLMTDDYEGELLAEKFKHFPHASRVLDWERSRELNGQINIERLMTRLDGRMPYDFDEGADEELGMLLTEVKRSFLRRLQGAKKQSFYTDELGALARYCVDNSITCITFNYDDVLDEALFKTGWTGSSTHKPYWHPDGGYGFFCRPSRLTIEDTPAQMDVDTSMLLLKLHGSTNWHPRRGYPKPYVVDAIVHHESWTLHPDFRYPEVHEEADESTEEAISLHIEREPFVVPPVLFKSALVEQPILRLVWYRAYRALREATEVTFVGYSFPHTDIAVRVLFDESLHGVERTNIRVVNLARRKSEMARIRDAYRRTLGDIADGQFYFRGALTWSRELVSSSR